jgi:hypothetical protein
VPRPVHHTARPGRSRSAGESPPSTRCRRASEGGVVKGRGWGGRWSGEAAAAAARSQPHGGRKWGMERENERIDLGFALFFVFLIREEREREEVGIGCVGGGDLRERAGAPLDASVGGGDLRFCAALQAWVVRVREQCHSAPAPRPPKTLGTKPRVISLLVWHLLYLKLYLIRVQLRLHRLVELQRAQLQHTCSTDVLRMYSLHLKI